MTSRIGLLLVALVVGLGATACGGGDTADSGATTEETTTAETTTTQEATAAGKAIFVANCSTCHTLSDADASGTVGPNLDGASVSAEAAEAQVRSGGGAMPSFEGKLSDQEIAEVAAYVAAASSG